MQPRRVALRALPANVLWLLACASALIIAGVVIFSHAHPVSQQPIRAPMLVPVTGHFHVAPSPGR